MHEKPAELHRRAGPGHLRFALITVSTSRAKALAEGREPPRDESYAIARSLVEQAGHSVVAYKVVSDDPVEIVEAVAGLALSGAADIIVTMGGTGPTKSDVTVETLRPLFSKELEGFGCLFRHLSYEEVGSAAFLSNATAGVIGEAVVFALPGSPGAARLALEKLILPEAGHVVGLVRRE